ncbi:helix-turn-helix transcriptional regulator [Acinetobacter sp. ANC 3832]|uniref:helix-turn-helix transcriptional regulator n=1 Tax=Acinetobacter sp. ANC 3832 TaxID=1977874 RepID=UPI000A356DEB|nr:helix-turn-helix transcriptional regulator [Acinetobacter sp. ANC 3832]OTG92431.1 helix-turn-helix transcriptional regulator [Acinetobacter sp. ANC 3832]
MLNQNFLTQFSLNFVKQVQRVLDIDGYLLYSIDNINYTHNYHSYNISKNSLDEYLGGKIQQDPVCFRNFYSHRNTHVELLHEYNCNEEYQDFMQRWQIQDTAEIFFRKRNGEPIAGLSIVRENNKKQFTEQDKKLFQSFYFLSEKYFQHNMDTLDKSLFIEQYSLTKKEIVILEEIFNGLENSFIAEKLNCSLATVKTHIQHIYQKTNVRNRQELLCNFLK